MVVNDAVSEYIKVRQKAFKKGVVYCIVYAFDCEFKKEENNDEEIKKITKKFEQVIEAIEKEKYVTSTC